MLKKIILLNPSLSWSGKTSLVREGMKNITGKTPPLGLAYIASVLRRKHDVRIIDANALGLSMDKVADIINRETPDMLGITAFYETRDAAREVSSKINIDGLKIVGGADPTTNPSAYHDFFDIVVIGEGEIAFKKIAEGTDLKKIRGIHFKGEGRVIKTPGMEYMENLDKLEFPAWDMLPLKKYRMALHYIKYKPNFSMIMTSRGCPYNCAYCVSHKVFPKYRARSPKNVFSEIKYLYDKFNVRTIYIWDDTFTLERQNVIDLCNLVIKEKMDLRWTCITRADKVDRELLRKMKKAGCFLILYGVESSCKETLMKVGRRPALGTVRNAIRMTKEAGIMVKLTFIFGLPGDNEASIQRNVELAKELNPDIVEFHPIIVLPGSGLEKMKYKPQLSGQELNEFVIKAYKEFYIRPRYILSRFRYVRNPVYLYRYLKCMVHAFS